MSYIFNKGKLIAKLSEEKKLKSGSTCTYAFHTCKEEIDMSRELNLVNAKLGFIRNSKENEKEWAKGEMLTAKEINTGEFLITR